MLRKTVVVLFVIIATVGMVSAPTVADPVDAENSSEVQWRATVDGDIALHAKPIVTEDAVYLNARSDSNQDTVLAKFNKNGEELWTYDTSIGSSSTSATLAEDGGAFVVSSAQETGPGNVAHLNSSGGVVWNATTVAGGPNEVTEVGYFLSFGSKLAQMNGTVMVGGVEDTRHVHIYGLDAETGDFLWEYNTSVQGGTGVSDSPNLNGYYKTNDTVYFIAQGNGNNRLVGLDSTGSEAASSSIPVGSSANEISGSPDGDTIYLKSGSSTFSAVNVSEASVEWNTTLGSTTTIYPTPHNGSLYVPMDNRSVVTLNAQTGSVESLIEPNIQSDTSETSSQGIVDNEGNIYFSSQTERAYGIAANGSVLYHVSTASGGGSHNMIAMGNGTVYHVLDNGTSLELLAIDAAAQRVSQNADGPATFNIYENSFIPNVTDENDTSPPAGGTTEGGILPVLIGSIAGIPYWVIGLVALGVVGAGVYVYREDEIDYR